MKILLLSFLLSFYSVASYAATVEPVVITTSVDTQKPESMRLINNPVKDGTLKIQILNAQSLTMNVVIINSLGKEVYRAQRSLNKQAQLFDVSTLASGIYFLRVNTESSNFVKKLIVQ
ncbi:T9SS type A sorting domain-containing protein [Nonlabens ponticola]|uniref:T9SS type A sorting domain-containing protein n=1 Tax=Nonlabens ponticola TaxID=2496866 RepID=A0A3S9N0E5_9FLAO|nr:T9SS type A sorting domain-containing protein [Nonlabens ponticola]AZQ44783.1 T9SS type A sorting domain-containing protein [Nonlabens ponticola]